VGAILRCFCCSARITGTLYGFRPLSAKVQIHDYFSYVMLFCMNSPVALMGSAFFFCKICDLYLLF
jgi:hypothetical protein